MCKCSSEKKKNKFLKVAENPVFARYINGPGGEKTKRTKKPVKPEKCVNLDLTPPKLAENAHQNTLA